MAGAYRSIFAPPFCIFLSLDVTISAQPDINAVMNETESRGAGRAQRFTEIFGACYGPVLAYARRRVGADLAQDVVADVFLAAWRHAGELPSEPLLWLYRAAHFAVANQRRALARQGRLDDRVRLVAGSSVAPDLSEDVAADLELAAAFRALSEADREVLRLAAWEGLTAAAAAEVIGCSAAAAKARLHRARQRLSQRLGADLTQSAGSAQPHPNFRQENAT
jgi:RNA polymerase sigma-70 factor (ECF subfamily)